MSTRTIETPIGALTLTASADAVTAVRFGAQGARDASALLDAAEAQLHEYFARTRRTFDLPLDPRGTAFELRVWAALRTIPYGETRSYGAIGRRHRQPAGSARRRHGKPPQPAADPHPLPPRHRRGRLAYGLCRRAGDKAPPAGAGRDHTFKINNRSNNRLKTRPPGKSGGRVVFS